jgi:tRNA (cmo5U34)-methyltransferase
VGGQFHFDPVTYLTLIRSEVPSYDVLQQVIAQATGAVEAHSILDLGTGTGVTAASVLALHPHAQLTGIDTSSAMLEHARAALPAATLIVSGLEDALPPGPFDLVTSALAIHHLVGPEKADLFRRVEKVLRPGGRFVFGDVIRPDDASDRVTPINNEHDHPSRLSDQVMWLAAAGLRSTVLWVEKDLAVVVGDKTDH